MDMLNRILQWREGGNVERSHTVRHTPGYTVGKHTFDMLILLDLLHPDPSLNLYRAVLHHDLHERWVGDIPAPAKRANIDLSDAASTLAIDVENAIGIPGIVADLTEDEVNWMHALDLFEFFLWTLDEKLAGNQHVERCNVDAAGGLVRMHRDGRMPEPIWSVLAEMVRHEGIGIYRTDERIL